MYKIVKSNTESKAYLFKKSNGKMNKIQLNKRDFRDL
ncbi:hypothetical protein J2T19_001993 [Paenibacillus tundrae]|uniref:Uncharacterized protein n=1 Tax=Paenibacillus tundrae TaxID=528187 RepID=A0ABT9WBF5_9BACL|nr:hypothetical protein [Paenibacillus tundrae]